MRRLFVLAAALGIMLTVQALRLDDGSGVSDPLTLAAIGFVVLAAFTVGELGGALKLPKITGYIVSGVVLGPQVWDVLSEQVVVEMQTFNTLALGLIATTAGLELDLSAIRKVFRTLMSTVVLKVPLLIVLVGGAFYAMEMGLGILGLQAQSSVLALGLVFAVLGVGTSPAIALAIINETGAKGRLSDLVLAIAVVKDLVVVVCLALAIAVARVLIVPDAPLGADVLVHVAEELGASIAVGAVVGLLLIGYMRFIKAEMLLAVLVAILVTAEVSETLHLELLLVFIAAGFVVRNFSKYEHELLHSLERIALPVFVVFFTTAGANVDLKGTLTLLPLALVIAAARAAAFFLASKAGAKVGHEAPPIENNAWFAYLPQAGVTLGLVFLAAEKLPTLAEPIEKTGMAMVALHLILGPILLGVALRRAGEIPEGATEAAPAPSPSEHDAPEAPEQIMAPRVAPPEQQDAPQPQPPTAEVLKTQVGQPELVAPVESVREALQTAREGFIEHVIRPRVVQARTYAEGIFADPEEGESTVMAMHRRLPKDRPDLVDGWVPAVSRLEQSLRAQAHELPVAVAVPMADSLVQSTAEDSLATWWRKSTVRIAGRLGLRRGRVRDVPVRLLGRLACEARLGEAAVQLAGAWPRSYAAMLDQVRAVAMQEQTPAEARVEVDRIGEAFVAYTERVLNAVSAEILTDLVGSVTRAGSPVLPLAHLRFSKVEPVARSARQRVQREASVWHKVADAAFDTVRARTAVLAFAETMQEVLHKRVHGPLQTAREQLVPVAGQVTQRLKAALEQLEQEDLDAAQLQRAVGLAKAAYPKADRTRVRRSRARFRRGAQSHVLVSELSRVIEGVPAELTVLPLGTVLGVDDRVESVTPVPLDFGRRAEVVFLERLAPRLAEVIEPVSDLVAGSDLRFEEMVQVAIYGIEAARQEEGEFDPEQVKLFKTALGRAIAEGSGYCESIEGALAEADEALQQESERAKADLFAMLGAEAAGRRVRSQVRATRRAIRQRLLIWGRSLGTTAAEAARRFARRSGLSQHHWRQQAGFDAAGMRGWIERENSLSQQLELPPLYDKLFSLQPIEDLRLAVAHREVLEQVSRRVSQRGSRARVLLVGEHGTGRSSMLNALELRHQRQRILRLDAFFHLRHEGVVSALAAELSCRDDQRAVVAALKERSTVVLVDDLERHVAADELGARELHSLMNIIVDSQPETAWVVTSTPMALKTMAVLAPVQEAFGSKVVVPSLSGPQLHAVVEARSRLAGVPVTLPGLGLFSRLRQGRGSPEEVYYAQLEQVSQGNLRNALQIYLQSLSNGSNGELQASAPSHQRLPFVGQLSPQGLAVLALLLRFGPHDVNELSRALRMPEQTVRLHTLNLLEAKLLYQPGGSMQDLLYIPPSIEFPLSRELQQAGLLPRGAS